MTTIVQDLNVKNPALLRSVARVIRLDSKLRPGRYHLTPNMSILSICKKVAYEAQDPVKLAFSSIRTQEQLIDKLATPLAMTPEELRTLLRDSVYCDSLGFNTETIRCMFLPDTHEVYWTISPKELLHKYEQSYHKFWDKKRTALAQKIGLTPVEVSIIASIVEEETCARKCLYRLTPRSSLLRATSLLSVSEVTYSRSTHRTTPIDIRVSPQVLFATHR